MSEPLRAAIFLLTATGLALVWLDRNAPNASDVNAQSLLAAGSSFKPTEFEYYLDDDDEISPDWIIFKMDDGRLIALRVAASTTIAYFPQEWATQLGLPTAFLEIQTGARLQRIDITGDEEAQDLLDAIFPPEGKRAIDYRKNTPE